MEDEPAKRCFFLGYADSYTREEELDTLTASDRRWFMKIGYAWNL